jgi:hypothetical protein
MRRTIAALAVAVGLIAITWMLVTNDFTLRYVYRDGDGPWPWFGLALVLVVVGSVVYVTTPKSEG